MTGVANDATAIYSPIGRPPGIIPEAPGTSSGFNPGSMGGADGQTGSATMSGGGIVVVQTITTPMPVAEFSLVLLTNRIVSFSNLCLNKPTQYLWDFGDGTTDGRQNPIHQFPSVGTFRVTLTVMNAAGVSAIDHEVIVTEVVPAANFSYAPIGKTVYFKNTSTVVAACLWDFGDGSTSSENDPVHLYATYGTYTVTLTTNGYVKSKSVEVILSILSNGTFRPNANGPNNPVYGSVINYANAGPPWDGTTFATLRSTLLFPQAFLSGGYVSVGMDPGNVGWESLGRVFALFDTSAIDVAATITSAKLRIYFSRWTRSVISIADSSLSVVSSNPASNVNILTSDWSSLGSTQFAADTPMPNLDGSGWIEIPLNAAGVAAISKGGVTKFGFCLACDRTGIDPGFTMTKSCWWNFNAATDTELIMTLETPPSQKIIASFTASVAAGNNPLTVNFTDTSQNSPTSWLWEFEAGQTSTSQNPSHVFKTPGKYSVRLTASNVLGSDSYVMTINVTSADSVNIPTAPPLASFTTNVALGIAPLTVNFTDTSTGSPTAWDWNWGDGTPHGSTQNPSHVFAADGQYIVILTVTDAHGWTSSSSKVIIVSNDIYPSNNVPTASIIVSSRSGFAPLSVDFSAQVSTDAIYLWDFGDGSTSRLATPVHLFVSPGTYTISLTVSNLYGSTTTKMDIVVAGRLSIASSSEYYYIIDKANHRILVYTKSGNYYGAFGGYGRVALGKFFNPTQLAVCRPIIGG